MLTRNFVPGIILAVAILPAHPASGASPVQTAPALVADAIDHPIQLDGEIDDWGDIEGTLVPLSGQGGADSVELRAAIRGDRIYVIAIW